MTAFNNLVSSANQVHKVESPQTILISNEEFALKKIHFLGDLPRLDPSTVQLLITKQDASDWIGPADAGIDLHVETPLLLVELRPSFFFNNAIDKSQFLTMTKRELYFKESMILWDMMSMLRDANSLKKIGSLYQFLSVLIEFQTKTNSAVTRPHKLSNAQIIKLLEELVHQHIEGSNLPTINTLAKQLKISPSKLKNLFKDSHHESFYQYYLNLKFEASKKIILQHSVAETANLIGFKVTSKFIIGFKKRYGITPFKYKQAVK